MVPWRHDSRYICVKGGDSRYVAMRVGSRYVTMRVNRRYVTMRVGSRYVTMRVGRWYKYEG